MDKYNIIEKNGLQINVLKRGVGLHEAMVAIASGKTVVKDSGDVSGYDRHNKLVAEGQRVRKEYLNKVERTRMTKGAHWDFGKLPKSMYNHAIDLFEQRSISKLIQMHDVYELSPYDYCCPGTADRAMIKWYGWAIETGQIYRVE